MQSYLANVNGVGGVF